MLAEKAAESLCELFHSSTRNHMGGPMNIAQKDSAQESIDHASKKESEPSGI